ncbi:aspartate-tRNA ligase [Pneumocystis carinii B80]|uniref:Aspartate-tRNA ligase n=1 Tax=Pneumocystis carinii (strain B80) TaxID=1408658 RepID=A0A0W4ZBF2_PNEC8|nr:aspartate-tRNA ligase [Pneumocystis carinii B80]KTW25764.1 aspartate-tRNA ligase [Pneumocystis carinii B80]
MYIFRRFGKNSGKRWVHSERRVISFRTIDNADEGTIVYLLGWFLRYKRKLSRYIQFYGLRDIFGKTVQLVLREGREGLGEEVEKVSAESVVEVKGMIRLRPKKDRIADEGLEVDMKGIRVINVAKPLPFQPMFVSSVNSNVRAKYRYLELRNPINQKALWLRAEIAKSIRDFFYERHFLEVETPLLFKSTAEGAREFIVPTRQNGYGYALPQSPQQYKQILMSSGIGRYYQLAKCFRNEDLRADRQPEFTQLDLEMSFVTQKDICCIVETLLKQLWKKYLGIEIEIPFRKISYETAMSKYGSDKPDLRYGLEIQNITSFLAPVASEYPIVDAIVIKNGLVISKNRFQIISKEISTYHQPIVVYIHSLDRLETWLSRTPFSLSSINNMKQLNNYLGLEVNDVIFLSQRSIKHSGNLTQLGHGRQLLYHECVKHKLMPSFSEKQFEFVWINEFPLFSHEKDDSKQDQARVLKSTHHPFTSPLEDDIYLLKKSPESVRADHYDIVVNGIELGGGSIRIHDTALQKYILEDILKLSQNEIDEFSHLFEILSSGCPPHGGIALGFDRLVAILHGTNVIRDVIAFPKTSSGVDPVVKSPGKISNSVLKYYNLDR